MSWFSVAKENGISRHTFRMRLKRGWSEERSATKPTRKQKAWTEKELEYLCKFYDHDGPELMAVEFERSEATIRSTAYNLRKSGKFDYYKNLGRYW